MTLKIAVVGAGALGSVFAAALAYAGAEVQILTRPAHADAINRDGLTVFGLESEPLVQKILAVTDAAELEPADLVFVATKSHDITATLATITHLRDRANAFISIANGVLKNELLIDWAGAERVLGATTLVGGSVLRHGVAACTTRGTTFIGPGGSAVADETARALAALLEAGGLPAVVTPDIDAVEWSKLIHVAPAMSITALPRMAAQRAFTDPALAELYVRCVWEGAAVMRAAGMEPTDTEGMWPMRTIANGTLEEGMEIVFARGRKMDAATTEPVRSSMLEDLDRGRPLELEAVHSYLSRRARDGRVAVPLSDALLALLLASNPARA
jgi:2-dehydropantoate 2-reductase